MFRPWSRLFVFAVFTLLLIPVQALSLALGLPSRRWIPVMYHRFLCKLIGVRLQIVGACSTRRPLLIVANHASWLDITVITAAAPVCFVAKSEIARWPLFGLLAKLQRSVFVDRNRRHKTAEVNSEIASRLLEGDPVLLFGEGTSSDGNRVLPFRTALIGAARTALTSAGIGEVTVQPLSIAYARRHGLPLGREERRELAWYGGMDLWRHVINVLRHGAIDVIVTWGKPIAYGADSDRKQIAGELETTIRRITAAARRGQIAAESARHPGIALHARSGEALRRQA
jgi:1-acyl-sn-glycerol-3-phosphate acyltransferase